MLFHATVVALFSNLLGVLFMHEGNDGEMSGAAGWVTGQSAVIQLAQTVCQFLMC